MMERSRRVIGPEGRDAFVVFCSFCEMDSRGVLLASFEVSFGSIGTLPLSVDGERAGRGTVTKHNLWLMPVNMGVMLLEPSVSKDNVVMS